MIYPVIQVLFLGIKHLIEINKRQKTHYTCTKYTIYKEKRKKDISITVLLILVLLLKLEEFKGR